MRSARDYFDKHNVEEKLNLVVSKLAAELPDDPVEVCSPHRELRMLSTLAVYVVGSGEVLR